MNHKVWVAVYEHRHGRDTRVFTTSDGCTAWRIAIAKQWWDREMSERKKPESDDDLAEDYFDVMAGRDEFFSWEEHALENSSPEDIRICKGCGESTDINSDNVVMTWQQWQCPCCGSWEERKAQ